MASRVHLAMQHTGNRDGLSAYYVENDVLLGLIGAAPPVQILSGASEVGVMLDVVEGVLEGSAILLELFPSPLLKRVLENVSDILAGELREFKLHITASHSD
jgi:hypothetical protein